MISEIPFLDELKITAGDEGITIHYNCEVSEKSPKLQHIKWSKNGETLNVNGPKFIGGSLKEKFCTLKTPSTDDRGKYTCTVSNAVGCTSKTVILGKVKFHGIYFITYSIFDLLVYNLRHGFTSFQF